MTQLPPPRQPLVKASPWPFAGMIGMACVAFLIGASVLVTPWYAVMGLSVAWLVTLIVAIRWWTPHPSRLPWLPVGLTALWFVTVVGGAAVFDWSS